MAPELVPAEPPATLPALPLRNPRRNASAYQRKLRSIKADITNDTTLSTSPRSQNILEELDRELSDVQERLNSVIFESKNMHVGRCRGLEGSSSEHEGRLKSTSPDDYSTKVVSFESEKSWGPSLCEDALEQHGPEIQRGKSVASSICSQRSDETRKTRVTKGTQGLRCTVGSPNSHEDEASTSRSAGSNYDNARRTSSHHSNETINDTKVDDWLAQGFPNPPGSPAREHSRSLTRNRAATHEAPPSPLSLFPPRSLTTGNLEYTPPSSPVGRPICPTSPMNNGRDAYGNYIASNARDYFVTQSPIASPALQPAGQDRSSTSGSSSPLVRLRGGGWTLPKLWKNGKEESDQGPGPALIQGVPKGSFAVNRYQRNGQAKEGQPTARTLPIAQSQFTVPSPSSLLASGNITHLGPSATNIEQHKTGYRGEIDDTAQRPTTQDSFTSAGSSILRADAVLDGYQNHFGSQPLPTSPRVRPLTIRDASALYRRADEPRSFRPVLPSTNILHSPNNTRSGFQSPGFPKHAGEWELSAIDERPASIDSLRTASTTTTAPRVKTAPRETKRWDIDISHRRPAHPPPKAPAAYTLESRIGTYHEYSDHDDDDESQYDKSIFSSNTTNDKLRSLPGLQTSDVYRKAKQAHEVHRIQEERVKRRQHDEQESRLDTDRSTIVPNESASQVMGWRPQREDYQTQRMTPLHEQEQEPHWPLPKTQTQATPHPTPSSQPTIAPSTAPPAKPPKSSIHSALSLAGKVSRFLLATPSDPSVKTYSRRHPPTPEQVGQTDSRVGMSADRSGWPTAGIPMGVPGLTMIMPPMGLVERDERERESGGHGGGGRVGYPRSMARGSGKGKGKERLKEKDAGVSSSTETDTRDFAPAAKSNLSENYTGSTLLPTAVCPTTGPVMRDEMLGFPRSGRRLRRIEDDNDTLSPEGGRTVGGKDETETASSHLTLFPRQDDLGNVYVPHVHVKRIPELRGGDGNGDGDGERCSTDSGVEGSRTDESINMRSSFSADSATNSSMRSSMKGKIRKEKKEKEKKIRELRVDVEDDAARAMAMHFVR